MVYANYIAVHESWRSGDIARAFARKLEEILREIFEEYRGTVFEVEKFDKKRVEEISNYLKSQQKETREFYSTEDRNEIRKFLRISWYQTIGCKIFLHRGKKEPLVCRSPCLDPDLPVENWGNEEEEYWLMWYNKQDDFQDFSRDEELWNDAVRCVYIEILAKSLVESFPNVAEQYWKHANAAVDRTLHATDGQEICLGRFLDRHDGTLLSEWYKLGINVPI